MELLLIVKIKDIEIELTSQEARDLLGKLIDTLGYTTLPMQIPPITTVTPSITTVTKTDTPGTTTYPAWIPRRGEVIRSGYSETITDQVK